MNALSKNIWCSLYNSGFGRTRCLRNARIWTKIKKNVLPHLCKRPRKKNRNLISVGSPSKFLTIFFIIFLYLQMSPETSYLNFKYLFVWWNSLMVTARYRFTRCYLHLHHVSCERVVSSWVEILHSELYVESWTFWVLGRLHDVMTTDNNRRNSNNNAIAHCSDSILLLQFWFVMLFHSERIQLNFIYVLFVNHFDLFITYFHHSKHLIETNMSNIFSDLCAPMISGQLIFLRRKTKTKKNVLRNSKNKKKKCLQYCNVLKCFFFLCAIQWKILRNDSAS